MDNGRPGLDGQMAHGQTAREQVGPDGQPEDDALATLRDLPPVVTVYWRPGCFFCRELLQGLECHGVDVELRNIWEDKEARAFVRRHNGGNETVPTVAFGTAVWTNPDLRKVTEAVREG